MLDLKEVMSSAGRRHLSFYGKEVLRILKDLRNKKVSAQHVEDALMGVYHGTLLIWIRNCRYGPKHPYCVFANRIYHIAMLLKNGSNK